MIVMEFGCRNVPNELLKYAIQAYANCPRQKAHLTHAERISNAFLTDKTAEPRRSNAYNGFDFRFSDGHDLNPMKSNAKDLLAELDRLGIAHTTITHPPVFTVEEAKQLRGKIEGGHTKNLLLKDKKDRLFLAVTLEDVPVDLTALGPLVGARGRLSFASPDLLREHLGVEPGSVTPFALFNNRTLTVTPVFDETMLMVNPLNFHPLENTATTAISSADLMKFVVARGHRPLTLRFPRRLGEAISES